MGKDYFLLKTVNLPTGDYWYVINKVKMMKREFVGHFTYIDNGI